MKRIFFPILFLPVVSDVIAQNPTQQLSKEPIEDSVYRKVEVEAAFPGGQRVWVTYLQKNLKAEIGIENFAPPGSYTVVVEFIVNKNGEISEIKPLTNHGFGMEEEVMRVVSKGPKWVPAIHNGRQVSSYRKQPVTFVTTLPFELSTYKLIAGKATTVEIDLENKKVDDIEVSISNGTIQKIGDKQYSILIDKPGRVLLTVKEIVKKKTTDLGTVALEVN